MAWDGTLNVEDFERAALYLVTTWQHCCPELPQWTWQKTALSAIPGRTCGYLMLQDHVSSDREVDVERLDESDGDDHDAEDQATMYEGLVGDYEQHLYTYHVVYNESYRVPMLFLRGCLPDGRPLQWNSVLQDLPVGSQHISNDSRWTFLTQEDHPLLHRPWFALHPCGTSEIMRLVFSDFGIPQNGACIPEDLSDVSAGRKKQVPHEPSCGMAEISASDRWEKSESWIEKYILTWMSFVCPAVGLAVPSRVFVESKCCKKHEDEFSAWKTVTQLLEVVRTSNGGRVIEEHVSLMATSLLQWLLWNPLLASKRMMYGERTEWSISHIGLRGVLN